MTRRCVPSKPTPTPLNGLAVKPAKTRRKVIEGNTDTIGRQTTRQNLPRNASVAGGRDEKGAMARPTTVKTLPRIVSVPGGGRGEEKRIEREHRREDKGNQSENPPQATIVAGGGGTKGENQHEMERWHNPQSREGGEVPSGKRIAKRKQKKRASQRREDRTYSSVPLCELPDFPGRPPARS